MMRLLGGSALTGLLGLLAVTLHGCGMGGLTAHHAVPDVKAKECKLSYDMQREIHEDAKEYTILATAHCSSERLQNSSSFLQQRAQEGGSARQGQRRQRASSSAILGFSGATMGGSSGIEVVLEDCRINHPTDVVCPAGRRLDAKALADWSIECEQKEVYKLLELCKKGSPGVFTKAEHNPKNLVAGTPSHHVPLQLDPKLQSANEQHVP